MIASDFGYYRIAVGSPGIEIANPDFNAERIIELAEQAHQKQASVLLLPELCLSGYTCEDLFHSSQLLKSSLIAIDKIRKQTRTLDLLLVFGSPFLSETSRIYNTAFALAKGQVLGVIPKCHLPNYGEFYEKRWFASGIGTNEVIDHPILGSFLLSPNQIFTINTSDPLNPSMKIGIEICEDLWAPLPPSTHLGLSGANVILNLSASNELVGKVNYRRELVKHQSAKLNCVYAYTSSGPTESTKDIVYSGHMMVAENGVILAEKRRFPFENDLLFVDVDLDKISHDRIHNTTGMWQRSADPSPKIVSTTVQNRLQTFSRIYLRTPFVPEDESDIGDRAQEVFSIQANGLARRILAARAKTVQIGVSGGLDSTLALLVSMEAFRLLGLPFSQVQAISMPGPGTSIETRVLAFDLAKSLAVSLQEIEISPSVFKHLKDIQHDPSVHDLTYENAQARMRTLILLDIANQHEGIMVGTSDLSELALGWCTYNGDQISGYHVNVSVPKTLVRHLIHWYSQRQAKIEVQNILMRILESPVSAELLPQEIGKAVPPTTEEILGPYEFHDFVLFHFVRNGFTPQKIFYLASMSFSGSYSQENLKNWLQIFFKRFFYHQFKRSCVPCGPKVGSVTLSPRGDWRMPDEASAAAFLKEIESISIDKKAA